MSRKNSKLVVFTALITILILPALEAFGKTKNIWVIHKGSLLDYWQQMEKGVLRATEEEGINLRWIGSKYSDNTPSQIKIVRQAIKERADAIVLIPTDRKALVPVVLEAKKKGIAIVILDSALDGQYHSAFIGSNNFEGGRLAARKLGKKLQGRGNVAILRIVKNSASTDARADGFIYEMEESYPQIQIVSDTHSGSLSGASYRSAAQMLEKHAEIHGIFAVNESATIGALTALREKLRSQQTVLVGYDTNDQLEQAVASGEIYGLIVQNPEEMAYVGIKNTVALLNGRNIPRLTYTDVSWFAADMVATTSDIQCIHPKGPNLERL